MPTRMSDLLASQAYQAFIGREAELGALRAVLASDGPRVVHVRGIAGIGKTALLERFAHEAMDAGAVVIRLDCRNVEPTERGYLQALSEAIGGRRAEAEALARRLGSLGSMVILAFDTYEVFRLLDAWLRQVFVPMLSGNVRVLFFGRESSLDSWYASPGWGQLLCSVPLTPLNAPDTNELLLSLGVTGEKAALIARATHGHPLALKLAAAGLREAQPGYLPTDASVQHALDELTRLFLEDVSDPVTRRVLEGASVTRRTTVSLLRSMFPELAPQDAYERLRKLPFAGCVSDGLVIHDAVRDAIASSLHASDPSRHLAYRQAAWRQLVTEAESASSGDLWRYTADMLYLIENPVVREAFFPRHATSLSVEAAQPVDNGALTAIIRAHEGDLAAQTLLQWWRRLPQSFSIVRNGGGGITGLYCRLRSDLVEPAWLLDDPVTAQWHSHLTNSPMNKGDIALFCRRWLSLDEADSPGEVQAAVWLDLKRAYMELRPRLRRVYLTVRDLAAYASVAQRLGFEVLTDRDVELDGHRYHSAVLDFGPSSVDGWLSELAAAELGMQRTCDLLDVEARELALDERRVALTPLEFGVMHHLVTREGKVVSRSELLHDVWDTQYEGGSNVVDAVVHTLRRKLGTQSGRIETVSGVGYRLKSR